MAQPMSKTDITPPHADFKENMFVELADSYLYDAAIAIDSMLRDHLHVLDDVSITISEGLLKIYRGSNLHNEITKRNLNDDQWNFCLAALQIPPVNQFAVLHYRGTNVAEPSRD